MTTEQNKSPPLTDEPVNIRDIPFDEPEYARYTLDALEKARLIVRHWANHSDAIGRNSDSIYAILSDIYAAEDKARSHR